MLKESQTYIKTNVYCTTIYRTTIQVFNLATSTSI